MADALNKMTTFFDSLYGAPGVLLVLVTCNALGYFLKMSSLCSTRSIPKWVVGWGIVGNMLFRALPVLTGEYDWPVLVWIFVQHFGRLAAIGFLIGVASCILYDKVLAKLEDQFPWLKDFLAVKPIGAPEASHTETVVVQTVDKGAPVVIVPGTVGGTSPIAAEPPKA